MSKMILLNTVRVQDSMVMYALSGGTLTVMLQYLNGFAANNVLLTVVGKTYAELLAETGFIEVARTGGTYIVNPYRVMTINNNIITFDNGMQIATHRFEALSQLFESYSYTRTLERGFAYITDSNQSLVPSKSKTTPHQKVQIHFYDGAVHAEISPGQ